MNVIIKNGQQSTLLNLPEDNPVENASIQTAIDLDAMTVITIVDADGVRYTASANLEE